MDRDEAQRFTDGIVSDLRLWLADRLAAGAREHGESAIQMRGAFRVDCFVDNEVGGAMPLVRFEGTVEADSGPRHGVATPE